MARPPHDLAWHFVSDTLRDGRPVPADGEWLRHEGDIEICRSGLHASERLIDALQLATANTICRVAVSEIDDRQDDELVARNRVILWRLDAEDILRAFARKAALSVIHLWDAPRVVREYLETGNDDLRGAAWDAAWGRPVQKKAARAARAAWATTWDAWPGWNACPTLARAATWAAAAAAGDTAMSSFNDELEALVREAAGDPDDAALLAQVQEPSS